LEQQWEDAKPGVDLLSRKIGRVNRPS